MNDWTGNKKAVWSTLGASNHSSQEREVRREKYLAMLNRRDEGICVWRAIAGYEDRFLISTKGDVFSLWNMKPMKLTILQNGYYYLPIILQRPKRHTKTAYIHRLLAETFIPNPEGKATVNHKDGDKSNNCVENLEWATQSEQNYHATRVLGCKRNTDKILEHNRLQRRFTDNEVRFIRNTTLPPKDIMRRLGKTCDHSVLYNIRRKKTYKDVRE